jgi:hypothetical protein
MVLALAEEVAEQSDAIAGQPRHPAAEGLDEPGTRSHAPTRRRPAMSEKGGHVLARGLTTTDATASYAVASARRGRSSPVMTGSSKR